MKSKTLQKRYLEEVMLLQLMGILSSLVRKAGLLIYGQSGKSRGIQTDTEYLKQDSEWRQSSPFTSCCYLPSGILKRG